MEQKIVKLFSYFGDIKNQPFYSSCISQIIQIYQSSPQSLKLILFNLNQLIFSPCKQVRLRLKHRQICASIISKLNRIYCQRVRAFIQDKNSFDLQSFQIEQGSLKFETKNHFGTWEQLDIFKVIENEKLLLATQKGRNQLESQATLQEDQKKIFDEFVEMKHATMLNMEELFKDFQEENQLTKQAFQQKRTKYGKKAEKYKQKTLEKQIKDIQLSIANPFNLMYDICIQNMLHSQWELRHLSVLILKELLLHSQFLGFSHTFRMRKMNSVEQRFQFLSSTTKEALIQHFKSSEKKKKIMEQSIASAMILLSLDRFADYQTDESLIIVRIVAAQILKTCFKTLNSDQQAKLFRLIKKIFDRDSPIHFNNSGSASYTKVKFTWEVKHSFLYFLVLLTEDQGKQYHQMIFRYFQQPFIKMLGNTQVDQVILCICKIFKKFVGQKFFQQKAIDRVNQQIWLIIQTLDDISISTKQTLSLLGIMFPHFKSNEILCLERIKKFFTSKIPQVRSQFYNVLSLLYGRNWKIPDKIKLIQQNTVQLLQAAIVQHEKDLFEKVVSLSPNIFKYAIKDRKIRKVLDFIKESVLLNEPTGQIIAKTFKQFDNKIKQEKIEYGQSEYLFIYEQDRVGIPSNIYAQKRIWKLSIVLSNALKSNPQGLQQLIRGIQKCSQTNSQKNLLIFLIMNSLIFQYKTHKLFQQYISKAQQFLKAQSYSNFSDPQIEIYIKEFDNIFNKLLPQIPSQEFKKLHQNYIKTKLNSVSNVDLHKGLMSIFENQKDENLKNQLKYLISILLNIMENQNDLMKKIKVLCSFFVVKMAEPQEPSGLNNVIKAPNETLKQDNFMYISQISSEAAFSISKYLYKKKKALYSKFNQNLITKIQSSYKSQRIKLRQRQNCVNLESTFMKGISLYIQKIGTQIKEWIQQFGDLFLKQVAIQQTQTNILKFNFLSGTIISVLKIDHKKTFLPKFMQLISSLTTNPIFQDEVDENDNQKMVKQVLRKSFLYFCQFYDQKANTFFQWYMNELKSVKRPFYKILQTLSHENLIELAPLCSIFIMRVVKSISIPEVQDLSMNSLSNLVVGVYTNNKKLSLSKSLQQSSQEGIQFIKNFKDTSKFNYQLKIKHSSQINLRNYQIQGITWLGFLCKYNLNGALCDDMGLGKTLQVLTLIENEYHNILLNLKENEKPASTLIVVPTTLVQHWGYQYEKYFQKNICKVVLVNHKTQLKQNIHQLTKKSQKPIIFITNYNVIQKNIDQFDKIMFKFIILDQGHIIKNVKTKKFKCVKRLKSQHRFILTGTPIQNRLKQLWGLFDFLMPGYLYTEELFKKHYQKLFQVNLTTFREDQLMFSQNQKHVLQKLHFKVMPFIMRRLKSEVLKQLPSKIINDYYCQLTQAQEELYKKFEDEQCHNKLNFSEQKNVLSVLIQMRKILNHPIQVNQSKKYKWDDSGKFLALQELFQQLSFGEEDALIQNKAIIFSRFTSTIDYIEELFLKTNFPKLKYLKLTGNTKIGQRFQIAQTFNGDSDIKVLLVTTAVGGQGLNLSSANVVIMFDHDYNPTVDMQAIDRAHRIGQRRVLNVYRLITKNTLQERIMGIQKFKTNLANAIVNIDNASIKNIKQSNLPQLLQNVRDIQSSNKEVESSISKSIYKQMISQLQKNAIETEQFTKKY